MRSSSEIIKSLVLSLTFTLKAPEYGSSKRPARYAPYPTFDLGFTLPSMNSRKIVIQILDIHLFK